MWMVEAKYGILASHLSISDLTLDIQQYLTNLFNLPPDKNSCCTKIASFSHQVLSVRLLSMFVPVLAWFCFPFENSPNPFGHVMQTSKNEFTLLVKSPEIHFYCTPSWYSHMLTWHSVVSHLHDSCCFARDRWSHNAVNTENHDVRISYILSHQRQKQNGAASSISTGWTKHVQQDIVQCTLCLVVDIRFSCCLDAFSGSSIKVLPVLLKILQTENRVVPKQYKRITQ